MKLVVNKEPLQVPEGITLLEIIQMQDAPLNDPAGVLCVVNGRISISPCEQILCEGDELYIMVIPVGG
jgi:sulfur carrier protein ThiS